MKNLWSDLNSESFIDQYAPAGIGPDLALRVYTTRLLGGDPRLVLHGGGNTSVKTHATDLLGDTVEVLCVKGSGADMASLGPAGLPAVRLAPLRRLRTRAALSDAEMVNFQRINLLDAQAPNPSVETLLHAFLPHKYVDHTHATAVLALANQPHAAEICRAVYGDQMGYVPYIMPGFALAQRAAAIYEENPAVVGLILLQHGIFTFGATARESYERMIEMVTRAEERSAVGCTVLVSAALPARIAPLDEVAPRLRGALANAFEPEIGRRWILDFRTSPAIRHYVDGAEVARYSQIGVLTPDHAIRTKNWPLLLPPPAADALDSWNQATWQALADYITRYYAYFERHNACASPPRTRLETIPRVVLGHGMFLFGVGSSKKNAAIAADLAVATVDGISAALTLGAFAPVSEAEMFAMEYWPLEQAKLGQTQELPLARQVAVITGGGSGIGAATARAFARAGAEVMIWDRDPEAARAVAHTCGGAARGYGCDVTDPAEVAAAYAAVCAAYGGVDIVISNAGAAWQDAIGAVPDEVLRASFEINFYAHQTVARHAVRVMRAQATGGCLLFNVSKQAVNPGPGFGPYGLPKAATLALMKQYALDYGRDGIRANAVNADRIRSGLLTTEMIARRAAARGVTEHDYLAGNLLGREVTAADVAAAFVYLAGALKTTACTITVDGGNIAASMR